MLLDIEKLSVKLARLSAFNPDEPRDDRGRWTPDDVSDSWTDSGTPRSIDPDKKSSTPDSSEPKTAPQSGSLPDEDWTERAGTQHTWNEVQDINRAGDLAQLPEEKELENPESITHAESIGTGITSPSLVDFADGTQAVFKADSHEPCQYERFLVNCGQQAEREVGAWKIARIVGMDDMVVPVAASRAKMPSGKIQSGLMSLFQPGMKTGAPLSSVSLDLAKRAAIFDYVIGNSDRHDSNFLVPEQAKAPYRNLTIVKLIDHGLAFPEETNSLKMMGIRRSGFPYQVLWSDDPRMPKDEANKYWNNRTQIADTLHDLKLPESAIHGVMERIQNIHDAKTFDDGDILGRLHPPIDDGDEASKQMSLKFSAAVRKLLAGGPGSGRHKSDNAVLYHGTTLDRANKIKEEGLKTKRNTYIVTTDKEYAKNAAEYASEKEDGKPAIVVFKPSASKYFKEEKTGLWPIADVPSSIRKSGTRIIPPEHIDHIEAGGPGSGCHGPNCGRKPSGEVFVSPNVKSGLHLQKALRALRGRRQQSFEKLASSLSQKLNRTANVHGAVGVWKDGAENSTEIQMHAKPEERQYLAAVLGKVANQKAVLDFQPHPQGKDALYDIHSKDDEQTTSSNLHQAGIEFHTLVPEKTGTRAVVYDEGNQLRGKISQFSKEHGYATTRRFGKGSFIGSWTNRNEGRKAYNKIISSYETGHPQQKFSRGLRLAARGLQTRTGKTVGRRNAPKEIAAFNPDEPRNAKGEWTNGESGTYLQKNNPESAAKQRLMREKQYADFRRRGLNKFGKPLLTAKQKLAFRNVLPADRQMQAKAESVERMVTSSLSAMQMHNNAPVDVLVENEGKKIGLEVKAMIAQHNDKITMKKEAIARKARWARQNHASVGTVVVDLRTKDMKVYYRPGVGSFRIGNMQQVTGGLSGLRKAIVR